MSTTARALAKDHLGRVALHLAALRGFNEVLAVSCHVMAWHLMSCHVTDVAHLLHLAALRGLNEVRKDVSPQDLVASQRESPPRRAG